MDKEISKRSIKRQKLEGKTVLRCLRCSEDDPELIELHHVYGRNNSEETVPLCKNCHFKVTKQQNKLPRKVRSSNASRKDKLRFMLVSMGVLMEGMGKQLRLIGLEADSLWARLL
ncbi:HNH endonuclease [uncultured Methanolobus sp.]|uniref:HNH endonuclease n=1 Tax=uncultured Methanolobus sp. TaxID=218300 RepID=UPI002AAAB7A7|nr:HNH endonuclease [uncultured Methanolobus sp.]